MIKRDLSIWNVSKRILKEYFPSPLDLVILFLMVVLALRVTLFTPGYLSYADVGWPLSPNLYGSIVYVPSLFVEGTTVSIFSFTIPEFSLFNFFPVLLVIVFKKNFAKI